MMGAVDAKAAVAAAEFARVLEEVMLESPRCAGKRLWVVYNDTSPDLAMVANQDEPYWKAGTVVHLNWGQWVSHWDKGDREKLVWTNVLGSTISHEDFMSKAAYCTPDDRRIIMWLD